METCALIHKHAVIAFRYAHDVVSTSSYQACCQQLDVVLVSLHVVSVACVASHWDSLQLAHEVVFQTSTDNLL